MASKEERGQANIAARCRKDGGLTQVSLGDLRTELGYDRLGRYVLEEIATNLNGAGLGYFPQEKLHPDLNLTPRKEQTVWVYTRDGGRRSQILDAIVEPHKADVRAVLDGLVDGHKSALTDKQKLAEIQRIIAGE